LGITYEIPYEYKPRDYQRGFWNAMQLRNLRRACCVWHRRAGKDKTFFNYLVSEATRVVGIYHYYFPTMTMGRKILWDGMDREGFKFLKHIPPELIAGKPNQQEMKIKFVNGSLFQIIGTDRLDVVGTNPRGCVFSEYSLQNPMGWNYVRPILAENQGWAIFNFTPRGRNHGYKLYQMAVNNPEWFCEVLTVDDTHAVTQAAIEAERQSGMSESMIQQEFWCSWNAAIEGSIYGESLDSLRNQGRIKPLQHRTDRPVYVVLDPGYHTGVVFFQEWETEIAVLQGRELVGTGVEGLRDLLDEYEKEFGYYYGDVFAPLDVESNSHRTAHGDTFLEAASKYGIHITPLDIEYRVIEGIKRTDRFLRRCLFDAEGCDVLLEALQQYHMGIHQGLSTDERPVYLDLPAKGWEAHLCDTMRYTSLAIDQVSGLKLPTQQIINENRHLNELYSSPYVGA